MITNKFTYENITQDFVIPHNSIVLGESLKTMEHIPDKSINLILCDLPYGTTQNKWDTIIPFDKLWEQYNRIIKDNGSIILFCDGMFMAELMISNKKNWRYNIIWKKGKRITGFLNAKKMPLRNHEEIAVFYKSLPTYNPIFTEGIPLHGKGKSYLSKELTNNNYGKFSALEDTRKGNTQKYPISILEKDYSESEIKLLENEIELMFSNTILNFEKPHPAIFPTQKPVALCEYIIETYTNETDLVLDNCMGSGSTIIAAINKKRKFIGIEKDTNNFKLAEKRIATETLF